MAPPIGMATFPGVERVISCSATLAHGITPGVFSLTIVPQERIIKAGGELKLTFGNATITFKDCKIDSGSVRRDAASGMIVSLNIFDRRWKWRFGDISGSYNLRHPDSKFLDNEIIDGTEKTPKEMAKLCLDAMGEANANVDDLPNRARPQVEWNVANPAQALAQLCEDLGCRIVLQADNKVVIRKAGEGKALPPGSLTEISAAVDPPEKPDAITVVCGPNAYEAVFILEAVAIDPVNNVHPIDSGKVSYLKNIDLTSAEAPDFTEIRETYGIRAEELARASLYRMYRIWEHPLNLHIPGYGPVERREQILPLLDHRNKKHKIEARGFIQLPPEVSGEWDGKEDIEDEAFDDNIPAGGNVFGDLGWKNEWGAIINRDFSVDGERGIVVFSDPIFVYTDDDETKIAPATLRLLIAVNVKDEKTRAYERYRRRRPLGGKKADTKDWVVEHEEIVLKFVDGKPINQAEVNAQCDHFLDAMEKQLQLNEPSAATYAGLIKVELDGAIQSVTWTVGGGTFTTVQRNQDLGTEATLPWKMRRINERNRDIARAAKQLEPSKLAGAVARAKVL